MILNKPLNCRILPTETPRYDRIYCGAACPPEHENYIKSLLNVNGILVMPLNDQVLVMYLKEIEFSHLCDG